MVLKEDNMVGSTIKPLKYWVQKVLPLVYDDSLSYYELLDKVVLKLNEAINSNNEVVNYVGGITDDLEELEAEIEALLNGDLRDIIVDYISEAIKHVYFGLTDSGYFVAYIPENWREVVFNTTGYDIEVSQTSEYGHLTLTY